MVGSTTAKTEQTGLAFWRHRRYREAVIKTQRYTLWGVALFPRQLMLGLSLCLSTVAMHLSAGASTVKTKTLREMNWVPINDTVMGGRSSSALSWNTQNHLVWTGDLSLENNGGFVSIRTRENWVDWSAYQGVEVVLEGGGRAVQVTLQRADMIVWAGGFRALVPTNTAGETKVFIPFSAFVLKRFGRQIDGPKLIDGLKKVGQLGLLISDKRPGAFRVVLKSVKPVLRTEKTRVAGDTPGRITAAIERGVPLFNGGDAKGCATVYRGLLESLVKEGKLGVGTWSERLVRATLAQAATEAPIPAAWTLRRTLDRLYMSLISR